MKKWMRRMALTLAGALLAGSLAVGAGAEEKDYSDARFRIAWWGGNARHEQTTKLVEEFEKAYPGLKIDVEYSGWGDYWTKLSTQAAGNDLPDVIQMSETFINSYNQAGLLLDLQSYVDSGALDLSGVPEGTLNIGRVEDKLPAIVTGVNAPAFIYDKAVLEEAGVTISQAPTMDEFLEVCRTVYEKTGMKANFNTSYYVARIEGMNMFTADGKSVELTAEALARYYEVYRTGMDEGYFIGVDDPIKESYDANLTDKVYWCLFDHTNQVENLETKTGMDLGLFALPADTETAPSYMKPSMLWSVNAKSENPDLAIAFLNYFVNEQITYDLCGMDRGMPISTEMRAKLEPTLNASQKKVSEFLAFLEDGHVSPCNVIEPSKASEARKVYNDSLEQITYNLVAKEDYVTYAQQVIDQMNAILAAE